MKRLLSLAALCLLTSTTPTTFAKPIEVNGMAAKVNGRVVTKSQVMFLLAPVYAQLSTQFPRRGPEFEKRFLEARTKIVDELIDREIILSEFKQMGAKFKPQFVDQEIKRQIDELYNGNQTKFQEELKNARLTMDGYRQMTRDKLIVQGMRSQHFADAAPPLPSEIQREYTKIKNDFRNKSKDTISFEKIFIPALDPNNPASTPQEQLAKAEKITEQLKAGASFPELAKTNSQDAYATEGGIQNNVSRKDLSPEFASILFEAKEHELLGPLQDPNGLTIIRVLSKNLGPAPTLTTIRPEVEERVRREKSASQYEKWMKRKRTNAIITRMPL